MSSRPLYIVDASVAVKWLLRDEPLKAQADSILDRFHLQEIDLVSAECIRYEVAGAIRKAHRTKRITQTEALVALETFLTIDLLDTRDDRLVISAYETSVQIGCSLYDAMYVALAISLDCPLIHADLRLRNALAAHDIPSIWLEDWPGNYP